MKLFSINGFYIYQIQLLGDHVFLMVQGGM